MESLISCKHGNILLSLTLKENTISNIFTIYIHIVQIPTQKATHENVQSCLYKEKRESPPSHPPLFPAVLDVLKLSRKEALTLHSFNDSSNSDHIKSIHTLFWKLFLLYTPDDSFIFLVLASWLSPLPKHDGCIHVGRRESVRFI